MRHRRRNKPLHAGFCWPSQAGGRAGPRKSAYVLRVKVKLPAAEELSLILLPDVHRPSFVSILLHRGDDWQSNKRVMLLHLITARHLHWTLRAIWQPWHGGDLLCQINTSPRIYIVAATMPLPVHWISKCFQVDCRLKKTQNVNCIYYIVFNIAVIMLCVVLRRGEAITWTRNVGFNAEQD